MDDVALVRSATPFVGRVRELGRLAELITAAADRRAAAVLVGGDAGVGKTSLVTEAGRRAEDGGALVLRGRCVDLGTGALPYLPFAEAFSQLSEPSPFRGHGPGEEPAERGETGFDRLALFEAVAALLGRLGDDVAPVLLVLEDLHWADPSSRDLLRFLLTRLGADRLLVVATYRSDDLHRTHPLRPLLAELQRLPLVERMDLRPFAGPELAAFLQAVAGPDRAALPGDLLARIADRSAGNAYFAEELLAAGGDDELPAGLTDVLLDRLERLGPAAQQVLRAAAVFGTVRIEDRRLRGVLDAVHVGAETDAGIREAVAHRLLVPDGPDRYAFRHALLQEAVYADLLPGERVRLHAAAAGQFADVAAELARHSLAAHDLPAALTAFLAAAERAVRSSAPAQALADYEQVLQLWDAVPAPSRPDGYAVAEIGVAAAMAAGDSGRHHRAEALARAALQRAEAEADGGQGGAERIARARSSLATQLYSLDRTQEARDLARAAIAELAGHDEPSPARVRARTMEVRVGVALSEPEAALALVPEALAEARALGLTGFVSELLVMQATAEGMAGVAAAADTWELARQAAEEAGDPASLMRVTYNRAIDRIDAGELAVAVTALEEALALAHTAGLAGSLLGGNGHYQLITTRWQLGDAEGALAVAEGARRLPTELVGRLPVYLLSIRAAREPQRLLAEAGRAGDDAAWDQQLLQTARAEALTWLGRPGEAVEAARAARGHLDAVNEPYQLAGISIDTLAVAALADQAAAGGADRDAVAAQAEPFLADARERVRRGRPRRFTMGPEGLAWLARLDAEADRLRGTDSAAGWARVAELFDGVSVYERARARWRQATHLVADGDREAARPVVEAARADAARLGAQPLAAALADLSRRARLEPAAVRAAGPDVLTPREREVMTLVADGLTNRAIGQRLFISEKTASVHVSNVLAKLGAASRAEAVAVIGRRGLLG